MSIQLNLILVVSALMFGQIAHAQQSLTQGNRSGEQVYKAVCVACHETGVAGAPKLGDRATWTPLIAEGQYVLTAHAWVGVRAMPARGGNADVSLSEFAKAVAFMANGSGAGWKDPDAKLLAKTAGEANKRLTKLIREQQAMQRELHKLANTAK